MRAVRRTALLLLSALGVLTSCGIPATGVVEAGGPASGVVPTIRVYFVTDGTLVAVRRQTVAPVDVESAVRLLLQGPSADEEVKRMTTLLPLPGALPTFASTPTPTPTPAPTPTPSTLFPDGAARAPQEADLSDLVKVTTRENRVSIDVSALTGKVSDLAAAQLICTAVGAQRVADLRAEPAPVTVTDRTGRRVEGTGAQCPAL
ncbi:hypothetical protein OG604_34940 [Streptomyces sp. NBC_01231]|nr:hypothetical protein OG604_34940 [Streptomyces sp. NBC_01231]